MTPPTKNMQPPARNNTLGNRWILIFIFFLLLLITTRITPALSSYTPPIENLPVTPSRTPAAATATPTTTATAAAAATATATATASATATATNTSIPTATYTATPSSTPEITVSVSADKVYLRSGPSTNFSKVRELTYGEPLILLGKLNNYIWLHVKTSDGQEGWIQTIWVYLGDFNLDYHYLPTEASPPTETSTPVVLVGIKDRWIDIDLSEQMLRAYDDTDLQASFQVSTGVLLYPTETGQYHIYVKFVFTDMHGSDYFLPDVPFTMFYSGDFSIHGTYWHHNFGTPMSRGCVNMDIPDAEWLYNWASVGTLVNIHR